MADNLATVSTRDTNLAEVYDAKDGMVYRDAETREIKIGTMPIIKSTIITLGFNSTYTIAKGYHNGDTIVKTQSLADATFATATADDIAENKTAWVNGVLLVGTLDINKNSTTGTATADDILENKTAWVNNIFITGKIPVNVTIQKKLNAGESYTIPYGLEGGSSIITAESLANQTAGTATAADIANNKIAWVNGIQLLGTAKPLLDMISDATATANEIRLNYTAYVKFGMVTGAMPEYVNQPKKTLLCGESFTVPHGYHDGTYIIQADSLLNQTKATATADDIRRTKTAWVNGILIEGTMIQTIAPGTDATATEFDISIGKTAWVNEELITGICPYDMVSFSAVRDNLYDITMPVIITIPEHKWETVSLIYVSVMNSTTHAVLYNYTYNNVIVENDFIEKDGDDTIISMITVLGSPKITVTSFVPDTYIRVIASGYTLLRG